ncbi:transposase [Levilactobacillus andaensis]|uniref:transposase n=1 Tax=Levilactobacillus andaensis TaxID=2799570 RepID=UPI001940803F|nr:transposase [Levilactobacillus andaensis]
MMCTHKFMLDDEPEVFKEQREKFTNLVGDNPWLLPALVSLEIIPATVMIHGFWKNRQLKKQLQIERERTKQLVLEHPLPGRRNGKPTLLAGPHHHGIHH